MTRMNTQKVARNLTTTLSGVLAVGLAAATAAPAFGQAHGTFTFTGSMHTARAFHTATLLQDGQVLVAGGLCIRSAQCNKTTTVLASAELYSPATGQWTVTGSMSTARLSHTATLLKDGEVLVTGGDNYNSGPLASAELYNPATGTWSTTGRMTVARESLGAVLLKNGEVLVAGGLNSIGLISAAELYDPTTNTFKATGSMNYARGNAQLTVLQNGQALIAGGNEGVTGTIAENTGCTAELFSNGQWRLIDLAFCGVTGDTAALLPNGDVVIDDGSLSQFFDPFTNVWEETLGQLSGGPLASLANGKVLLAAGSNAELYDPSTNVWTQTDSLKQAHLLDGLTLTRLLNGQVLAVGGWIETRTSNGYETRTIISTVASAELYTP
jgi:hypothetical protein